MEKAISELIEKLGYDIEDPNFKDTPSRVQRMFKEFEKPGYEEITNLFKSKFPTNYKGMVCQKGIKTFGLCPHHLKDITYSISFGIIYTELALGLSKFTRVFKRMSKQLILQEELTQQIANAIEQNLRPKGFAIVVSGVHGCMSCRGVQQAVPTITAIVTGPFNEDQKTREEFFRHISAGN